MALLFWERVNKTIKTRGQKQEWLAEQTGIKYQTLRSWVSKDILPRVDDAVKIAQALEVSVEYLLEGVNSSLPREIDVFYTRYKKFSVLLEYLEELTLEQREDIEAFALTLLEKKQALEARKHSALA
ncbi:MAG: helix-turn-helix domain-containing protein [Treponema sp.]|jgi:transcriptional regulator with XRE-family HTH domain|nr:helix-turn-helix domain-containing protein [Treponema sp.]